MNALTQHIQIILYILIGRLRASFHGHCDQSKNKRPSPVLHVAKNSILPGCFTPGDLGVGTSVLTRTRAFDPCHCLKTCSEHNGCQSMTFDPAKVDNCALASGSSIVKVLGSSTVSAPLTCGEERVLKLLCLISAPKVSPHT